jgi:hypothetical protein
MASLAFVWTAASMLQLRLARDVQRFFAVPVLNSNPSWRMHAAGLFLEAL